MFMKKQEFDNMCQELLDKGYKVVRKYPNYFRPDGKDYFYKVIDRASDEDGDSRSWNQLIFYVWHLEDYADRVASGHLYSLCPKVDISRTTSERVILELAWPERSIDELEQIAKDFGEWVKSYKGLDLKPDDEE